MPVKIVQGERHDRLKVLIAGGGVAALEALIGLHRLAGSRVEITLLAPEREFVFRPLAVAEPFGLAEHVRVDLDRVAAEHGAARGVGALAAVEPDRHSIRTDSGEEMEYDVLLLAIGTHTAESLPGALAFRGQPSTEAFGELLSQLERGELRRVAFAVPWTVRWPLPLYELALLTARRLGSGPGGKAEVALVTHEAEPLEVFGEDAAREVATLLADAGVETITDTRVESVADGRLTVSGGDAIRADRVVTLPKLYVPEIEGISQGSGGFIATDSGQRVERTDDVYAAGDATWFPIKHGGLAAQQADTAARAIAERAGAPVAATPAALVLHGALLTGSATRFLRAGLTEGAEGTVAGAGPLWWPPGKVAGRHLAPYLAALAGAGEERQPMADLAERYAEDPSGEDAAHQAALDFALTVADAEAGWGDYDVALRWLDAAEQLNVALPERYADRRERWRELRRGTPPA